jgi:hypothetical protein
MKEAKILSLLGLLALLSPTCLAFTPFVAPRQLSKTNHIPSSACYQQRLKRSDLASAPVQQREETGLVGDDAAYFSLEDQVRIPLI